MAVMNNCAACCKLEDFDHDILKDLLKSDADVAEYLDMIDPSSGWCKWFDSFSRTCSIYDHRPRLCSATPQNFNDLYDVPPVQFDDFVISCYRFHISNSFGEQSQESSRYNNLINSFSSHNIPLCVDEQD